MQYVQINPACSYSVFTLFLGLRNDLLSVDIERSDYSNVVEIVCRPLTRFKGTASCEVSYTTQPSGDVYTEISHSVGGAEDIISVVLITPDGSEAVLPVSAATRGGQQDVVVEGTLETGTFANLNFSWHTRKHTTHILKILLGEAVYAINVFPKEKLLHKTSLCVYILGMRLFTGNKHPENNNVSDFLPSEEELMNQFCPENEMTDTS